MTSNEKIGKALNSSDLTNDQFHTDVDVVAALAFASPLGQMVQGLASAGDKYEIVPTIEELAKVMRRACNKKNMGCSTEKSRLIARQALREWLIRVCRACNGSGHRLRSYNYLSPDLSHTKADGECDHCAGTGRFSPTWDWRLNEMALPDDANQRWFEKRLSMAIDILDSAYSSARREVSKQLW